MSEVYDHNGKVEENNVNHMERLQTAGGHQNDRTQPSLPVVHRTFANPAPLGLLSFATGIFLISILGVHARGVQTPNVLVGILMFFGGVCQFIAGIMEFITGNTVCFPWTCFVYIVNISGSLEPPYFRLMQHSISRMR
jgi:uncharacterized protein